MEGLFHTRGLTGLTRFTQAAAKFRQLGTIMLGGLALPLVAHGEATVDVSPLVAKSTVTGSTNPTKEISVVLVLPLKDAKGAAEFAQRVSSVKDELYGKFLTPQEFAATYGGDEADYTAVKEWAKTNKLKISQESVSRTTLTVRGTVAQFEALFNTHISDYRSPKGDEFYSASTKPTVPIGISAKLIGVIGLTSSTHFAPLAQIYKKLGETPAAKITPDTAGGTGPGGAYSAADLRTAYSIPALGGTVPQIVAVFEQGGFDPKDVEKYLKTNDLPHVPVTARNVNGYGGGVNDPGVELEAVLDIDMVIGLNPAVNEVLVYEDGDDPFGVALIDALADVASDNLAQTLSISYGTDEVIQGNAQIKAEGQQFVQLAAQGQTVLVSSGDQGAYGRSGAGLNASDPGAQPLVTSVGGTSLFTFTHQAYIAEEVWNDLGANLGATGGGVSAYWAIPSWQIPSQVTPNGGSATNRNFPDISAVGNPATGVAVYSAINGGWIQIGGTSVSSPIWGGYISVLNSARLTVGLGKIGFFNPLLYSLAPTTFGILNDILDGSNGNAAIFGIPGYNAGPGYDNCTGWGSMNGQGFASGLLLTPTKGGKPPGTFGGLAGTAQTTTIKASWAVSKGATGYLLQAFPTSSFAAYNVVSKGTSGELTGLAPGTTYFVQVDALNQSGATTTSSGIYLTTKKK